ncbi:MAG: YbaB/EbfC family nucleoid-associated protein [Clostridia bacterium]|nr:YbaB/EbfC family nucleoid-associated protein [Clostridia bacterium]
MAKNKFTMGGAPNMNNMIRQAQKMQAEMEKIQAEVEEKTIETTAGGGMVTVTIKGNKEIVAVKINPEVVDPDDVETLEDLILVAVNDAVKQASDLMEQSMGRVTGNLSMPGLF